VRKQAIGVAVALAIVLPPSAAQAAPSLSAYKGLGAWIDIYDPDAWKHPAQTIQQLVARGVRTLYLETNNYHMPGRIRFPGATGRFIDRAHENGMKIVAWYLPGFKNMERDRRRAMAAIRFRSQTGGRFDSFALDIESSIVSNVEVRTRRLLRLSSFLRRKVGSSYPMGAIIPSPRGMQILKSYWPGFPYQKLARKYNVFLTMTYYSFRAQGAREVTDYMRRSMNILRRKTGIRDLPIHAIGGLADASSQAETRAFVRVVREYGLLGGSIYDDSITGPEDWAELARIQPNPLQHPAMPFRFGVHTGAYGKIAGGDQTHPDEVIFRTGPRDTGMELSYEGFDLGVDEVDLQVNWQTLATLPASTPSAWTTAVPIVIPATAFRTDRPNVIAFVPRSRFPNWPAWGVRNVAAAAVVGP
jgi:hypothetical protein